MRFLILLLALIAAPASAQRWEFAVDAGIHEQIGPGRPLRGDHGGTTVGHVAASACYGMICTFASHFSVPEEWEVNGDLNLVGVGIKIKF